MSDVPWPLIVGLVPLGGVLAILLLARTSGTRAKRLALLTSLVVLGLAIAMSAAFETGGGTGMRFQFTTSVSWIPSFGIRFALGVDGIALVLVDLVAVLVPVVVLASWHDVADLVAGGGAKRSEPTFFALLLVLETLMIGVFAATDVFLFYVLFEVMLIPMYFLIGSYGGPRRSYAAMKFLLYSLLGGLLMLAAVIGLYVTSINELPTGGTFDFLALTQLHISEPVQIALFLGFFIAFAIKAPLWPFHTWLPDAAAESPTGGSVLLVGVLDKVGTFGFIRYCIPLFPLASRDLAPYIIALSIVGIFYGAFLAMGQRDLKRLVSYTSVAHFGFITLGIFALTSQGQAGGVFYMVNHGFSTGALFLIVGFLIRRQGSRLASDYGGVRKTAPLIAGSFLVAGMSSLALPGLNSFVSEFLVLVGTFTRYRAAAIIATVGIILAALYILLMYQRTMQGPLKAENVGMRDLTSREAFVIAPVLALVVALGVYPKPVLDVVTPAVNGTLQVTGVRDPVPSHPSPVQASGATP